MKLNTFLLPLFLLFFFVACDNGGGGTAVSDSEWVKLRVDTYEDLPNCSKNREGERAKVKDKQEIYECTNGYWELKDYYVDTVMTLANLPECEDDVFFAFFVREKEDLYSCVNGNLVSYDLAKFKPKEYRSEDDLPVCSSSRRDEIALVNKVAYRCHDGRWKDMGFYYATDEDLKNCTAKRDGERAYVANYYTTVYCEDGVWNEE